MRGEGAYRALLRLALPPDLRRHFQEEMVALLGERLNEARAPRARLGVWARAVGDVLRHGLGARLRGFRRPTPRRSTPDHAPGGHPMETLVHDLRHSVRLLVRQPLLPGVVILTTALAIAATTTVFGVVNGVLLEPLPYAEPDRLVMVWEHNLPRERDRNVVSPANYLAWVDEADAFESLAALAQGPAALTGQGEPERVGVVRASPGFFPMLGVRASLGRLYTAEEDRPDAETVALLSHGFWQRRFGGDPAVIGRTLTLAGRPATVVGVLPAGFGFELPFQIGDAATQDVWLPWQFAEEARTWSGRYLQVVGRLTPGVTLEAARDRMTGLAARLEQEFPDRQAGWTVNVVPLREQVVGDVRGALLVLMGAVALVLLIACANVANLLLARAADRQHEVAVRAALGAGRRRLVAQFLAESLILAVAGGALGVLLSAWALGSLRLWAPDVPRLEAVGLDGRVLAFSVAVTVGAGLAFGLVPALRASLAGPSSWLGERSGASGRPGLRQLRGLLVVAQVSLSLVLLIGAGLLVRSLVNLMDTDVGFEPEGVLVAGVQLPGNRYPEPADRARFFEELVTRAARIPGVEAASAITFPPLAGAGSATSFWPNDRPVPGPGQHPTADVRWVHRDYHRVLGVPLLSGRLFQEGDRAGEPLVVVVSQATARLLWPGRDPVGQSISMPWGDTLVAEIVGVVGDVHHVGPQEPPRSMIYWHHEQFQPFTVMTVMMRSATGRPEDLAPVLRRELRAMDPDLPLHAVRTLDSYLADTLARARFSTVALGLFAALALVLAAVGIYGVISYATGRRVREIGIRMALGADRPTVRRMVLGDGARLVLPALALGAAGALALTRLMRGMVFEVGLADPTTFAAMMALLGAIGLLACWLPARRASTVDPVQAIRSE